MAQMAIPKAETAIYREFAHHSGYHCTRPGLVYAEDTTFDPKQMNARLVSEVSMAEFFGAADVWVAAFIEAQQAMCVAGNADAHAFADCASLVRDCG